MRLIGVVVCMLGCGTPEPPPRIACQPPTRIESSATQIDEPGGSKVDGPRTTAASATRGRCEEAFRYALVGAAFEPTLDVSSTELVEAWRAGRIAASPGIERALADRLGARGNGEAAWAIVPAHELEPGRSVITVDGKHPLVGDGPLVVPSRQRNIDRAKLTVLVMSGTTALTGRTSERIDTHGVDDILRYIKPFFTSADLVHVSNEVSFVEKCKPRTGQDTLIFCARDRYIELLEALDTKIVELTGSHLTDYGERPLKRTIDMYEARGWVWFGGGRTQVEALAPRIVEHNGNRLAFVGCNAVNEWVRHLSRGLGTGACDWPSMKWQIADLARRGYTVIATVQHRELRTHTPAPDLVRDLRGLAEAGARFVLGSQAHVAHPWDVHHGAYVHYGPGNILFAQHREEQREASADKLYIYEGRLLSVAHLYVRTEHGQPRLLRDDERAEFLAELRDAAAAIEPPRPDATPVVARATRERPDALLVRGRRQQLRVVVPVGFDEAKRYPLVVDMDGTLTPPEHAFYAKPVGAPYHTKRATGADIAAHLRAKYAIDSVTITPAPPKQRRHRRRHRSTRPVRKIRCVVLSRRRTAARTVAWATRNFRQTASLLRCSTTEPSRSRCVGT